MSSNYPGAVDTFEANTDWTGDPNAAPATARISASDVNNLQDGLHNTQATLGTNPQGSYADVKTRLDALAAGGGAGALTERGNWTTITGYSVSDVVTQTGIRYVCRVGHTSGTFATDLTANKWVALDASGTTAGGDLSGTLPNPTVAKVNGVAVTGTPTSGQVITATSGTAATWQTPSGGGGGAVSSVVGQTGAVTGTQILADTTVAAALTAKADASATTTALAGKLATTAGAVGTTNLADGSVTAVKVAADVATQAELDAAIAGLTATYAPRWTATAKTGAYTAVRGELVLADATAAGFTVTLPASPTAGDAVAVKKIDAGTNIVTVVATGKTIDGDPDATIVSEDAGGVFTYDGTNWRVTAVMQTASSAGVTSVAGRTGAVTLVAVDVTDLPGLLAGKASTSHATTHGPAGSDPLTVTQSQVSGLTSALGALAPAVTPVAKTAAYTAAAAEFVRADATGGAFTVTLPSSPITGAAVIVRKTDASANVVTVAPSGTGTIDGDATASITSQWGGGTFMHVGGDVWLMTSVTGSRA